MNKKIILAVFAVLIVLSVALCACTPKENPPSTTILDLYDDVNNAKSATQVITVKNGTAEIAIETFAYNYETGKVNIERKTLNSSDADELYTTTTETKNIEGRNTAKLTAANLKDVTENETTLTAKVANDKLNTVFGIAATDVIGDATVKIVREGEHIVSLTVNYTSANGNTVEIVTNYVY